MGKKKTTTKEGPSEERAASDQSGNLEMDRSEFAQADPFLDFTFDEGKVELERLWPKTYGGEPSAGWLCLVTPGMDKAYVAETYGGGKYVVKCRNERGQFLSQRTFEIAGAPKILKAEAASEIESAMSSDPMFRDIQKTLLIKKLLGGTDGDESRSSSVSDERYHDLVLKMLDRPTNGFDVGKIADALSGIIDISKQILPSGSGETSIKDLIFEGLKSLPSLLGGVGAGPNAADPRAVGGRSPGNMQELSRTSQLPSAHGVSSAPGEAPEEMQSIIWRGEFMTQADLVQLGQETGALIINWYLSATSVDDAVAALDFNINLDLEAIAKIEKVKGVFQTGAVASFQSVADPTNETLSEFKDYFKCVVDGLLSSKRRALNGEKVAPRE